jgi:phospholipid/cholesterol/gamma-HCH transport system substrate-binding protein
MKLETKVGAFFIVAITVLGMLILRMEKLDLFGGKSQHKMMTEFDQVAGLSLQSAVRVAGVRVGSVTAVDLDGKKARVTMSLPKDFPVYRDATASLSAIGILGEKYIELDPGHPAAGQLPAYTTIPSKAGMGLDNLMESLGSIAQDVKSITGALNQSIGGEPGRQKLDEIVDNIRVLTGEFRAMAQENHGTVNATLANVQQMTGDLRERLPLIAKQFEDLSRSLNELVNENRPELKGSIADVHKLVASFQATSDNIHAITDKLNKGEGTIGKLLTDDTTVVKLNAAVDNLNSMLGGFKSMGLELDMNAARWTRRDDSMAGFDISIVPSLDHWYGVGFHSTPDGKIGQSSSTVDVTSPTPTTIATTSVNTTQTFTFNAEYYKRLADHYVLHAGMVESTGGLGAEYRALDDRFRVGVLGYDFSKRDDKPNPRYRITSSFQFYKGLYGQAGVQDLANSPLRTFFVGGGVRWSDEDLKKLVGLATVGH